MICETFVASTSAANWPLNRSQSAGVPLNLVMTSRQLGVDVLILFLFGFLLEFQLLLQFSFLKRISSSYLFSLSCASCSSFSFSSACVSTCLHSLITTSSPGTAERVGLGGL